MYIVYVIKSIKYSFIYVGITNNLERRLKQHNRGRVRSSKHYAPYKLIYTEIWEDRLSARKREIYLKSTAGKNYLQRINSLQNNQD